MKDNSKILNERDKVLFEKALKLYIFARQIDIKKLKTNLAERLHYTGSVAYSLIITFARTGNLKIEYMDFLNEELKTMLAIPESDFAKLQIKPREIDDIELMSETKLSFFDEDENKTISLVYFTDQSRFYINDTY